MKKFNIVKKDCPVKIHNTFLPFGSVYGTFTLPKNRAMDYYISELRYCTKKPAYKFQFWDNNAHCWKLATTSSSPAYKPFLYFVDRLIRENGLYGTKTVPFVDHINGRRRVPREYIFKSAPGYVLSNRTMTDDTVSNVRLGFALEKGKKAPATFDTHELAEKYGLSAYRPADTGKVHDFKPWKVLRDGKIYCEYADRAEARAYIQLLVESAPTAEAAERVCKRFKIMHVK